MESKRKCARKRAREAETSEKLEELIISSTKRRKSTKDDSKTRKQNKNKNSNGHRTFVSEIPDKTRTSSKTLLDDAETEEFLGSSLSRSTDNQQVHCLASHVRKTYAVGNKRKQAKKDRSKVRGSLRSKTLFDAFDKGKSESIHKEEDTEVDDSQGGSLSLTAVYTEATKIENTSGESHSVASDNCVYSEWKEENLENEVQMVTHGAGDNRSGNENITRSYSNGSASHDVTASCSQQMKIASTCNTTVVLSAISTPSYVVTNPVTCPVLCHSGTTGIPFVPVPSLNSSTSAITSVSTPIVTLPLLPDVTQDISGTIGHSNGTPSSLLRSILRSDLQLGCQSTTAGSLEDDGYSSSNSQNQVVVNSDDSVLLGRNHAPVSTCSATGTLTEGGGYLIHPSNSSHGGSLEAQSQNIPLISIEDDCETLLIEKSNTATVVKEDTDASISLASTSENNPSTTTTLKVDNWAAYLLQRLEILFDREEECDLILRFSNGEVLKAHRTIISACTSLLSEPQHSDEQKLEVSMPPELDYASVEPVLRFVYSGRLDVRGSKTQLSAIYIASQILQVSLLTRLMDRRFPHLTPRHSSTRQQAWKRNEKASKYHKQKHWKGNTKGPKAFYPSKIFPAGRHRSKAIGNAENASDEIGQESNSNGEFRGTSTLEEEGEDEEEEDGQDGSVYFLVTNSQKIAQANAAVRRKRPAETARPTRFELEEDAENNSVQIATWSSKAALPPYYPSNSCEGQESSITVNTSGSNSTVCVTSPNNSFNKSTSVTWSSSLIPSDPLSDPLADDELKDTPGVRSISQPHNPFSLPSPIVHDKDPLSCALEQTLNDKTFVPASSNSVSQLPSVEKEENIEEEEDAGTESEELMEKISNICKQLEDGDSDDNESSCEEIYDAGSYKMEPVKCEMSPQESQVIQGENLAESSDCIVLDNPSTPTKSILKKKKEKNNATKTKKRVSFPLDENNELINEVATYSNSKEPAQSLIDVQKTVGSFRSSEDSPSPVKLTLSLKKKVLMNLALDDSESSHDSERSKSKKDSFSSGQSTSQGISQGDMSNHAKIISEVLKKYPHLVKDRKNIRLKILKKGSDKSNSGKLVKSKVQYLVLSENEHKTKSSTKSDRNSTSGSKTDTNASSRAIQSSQSFECPECEDVTFPSYFTFKKHVTSEHKDKSSSILASIENVPYACYTCFLNEPLEFSDYCSYQQHMKEVHSKREARLCSMCGYRPGRKLELAYHQYIEHNKLPRNVTFPKCDLCDHVAMNDAALLKHRSQHANADNYTCSVCGVAFRSFGALQGHMQTKLCQNKPSISYKCPYCPQVFARSYNLKAHCKSSHRAAYIAAQAASSSAGDCKQEEPKTEIIVKKTEETTPEGDDTGGLSMEHVCETLTGMNNNNQSSSEAEALSTVANSLAASLGLPEETVNHYMYTQGGKLDFTGNLDTEKYEENVARANEVNTHLMESAASVSGYSGNLPMCHDGTYTSQSPISTTAAVGAFYPVGVVPGQLVPGQIVSGEILPSQMLPGACVNVAGSAMLGAPSHSWTYVTYQVPTSGEDLPAVIADTSNIASVDADQSTSSGSGVEMPVVGKSSKNESINSSINSSNNSNSRSSSREPTNPLVVMTNTATQVSISHGSHIPTPQGYDAFSSQFV